MCDVAAILYERRDTLKGRVERMQRVRGEASIPQDELREMQSIDRLVADHSVGCVECDSLRKDRSAVTA